jgi:hypothetical protein
VRLTSICRIDVPPLHIYVLGDNATESGLESRTLGEIALERYVGRSQGIYMSSDLSRIAMKL